METLLLALSDEATVATSLGAALLGAAVGGLVTGKVTRRLERERQAAQDERDRLRDARLARAAVRALRDRFAKAQTQLNAMEDAGVWFEAPHDSLLARVPESDLRHLGGLLADETWQQLTSAEVVIALLVGKMTLARGEALSDDDREFMQDRRRDLDAIDAALAEYYVELPRWRDPL